MTLTAGQLLPGNLHVVGGDAGRFCMLPRKDPDLLELLHVDTVSVDLIVGARRRFRRGLQLSCDVIRNAQFPHGLQIGVECYRVVYLAFDGELQLIKSVPLTNFTAAVDNLVRADRAFLP